MANLKTAVCALNELAPPCKPNPSNACRELNSRTSISGYQWG